jgi:outer membrane protein, multidrug efflux system
LRIGAGNELDVTLAKQTLETARDSQSQIDLAYKDAVRAIEVLVGRYPAAQLETAQTFDALADAVPAGLPSELLERRLDVQAAEHRIAAAFSQVEEARAAKLPTLSLSAGLSHITSDLFVLDRRDDIVKSVGGTVFLPIFDGGYLTAQVEARTAQQHQAVALWAQTGLKAFSEVETALAREASLRDREPILTAQLELSQRALELEQVRYRVGSTDMRPVLQQQMATYGVRTALLRVQSERRVQRVNLYLALGGDFGVEAALAQSANR